MEDRITLSTICRHTGTHCRVGYEMMQRLRRAMSVAHTTVSEDLELSGCALLDGCDRPCRVAYHSDKSTGYLFGDVAAETDVAALVASAKTGHAASGPAATLVLERSTRPVV